MTDEVKQEQIPAMTPAEYFSLLKDKKGEATHEGLQMVYDNAVSLARKYEKTNQNTALRKLIFHLECIEKEHKLVDLGINTFIYKDDIEYYNKQVADKSVCIIELEKYEREIPEEIVETLESVKGIFDQFYVLFTDYTGEVRSKIEKERQEKDPILFGAFQNRNNQTMVERFYVIGDWEDEYCDLTLDKMIEQAKSFTKTDISHNTDMPLDIEALKERIQSTTVNEQGEMRMINESITASKKKPFFKRVRSFIKGE